MSVRTSTYRLSKIDSERSPRDGQRTHLGEVGTKYHKGTGKVVSVSRVEQTAWKRKLRKAEQRFYRECERTADAILISHGAAHLAHKGRKARNVDQVEAWILEAQAAERREAVRIHNAKVRAQEEAEVRKALRLLSGQPAEVREPEIPEVAPKEHL